MNDIIRSLNNRKSVRVYEDREIPSSVKREILFAAMAAPSAGNQQLYTILDITDQAIKDRLAVTCDNQPFIARSGTTRTRRIPAAPACPAWGICCLRFQIAASPRKTR